MTGLKGVKNLSAELTADEIQERVSAHCPESEGKVFPVTLSAFSHMTEVILTKAKLGPLADVIQRA